MIALSFSDGRDLIGATIPIRFRLTIALPTELLGVRCDVCWQRSSYLKEGDHRTYADVVSITIDDALWVRRSFQMAQDGKEEETSGNNNSNKKRMRLSSVYWIVSFEENESGRN